MSSLSDLDWIFIVLAALYLFEMLVWVRPGMVAFSTSLGRFGARHGPRRLTGNEQGDLVISGPAPVDVTCLVQPLPVSIGTAGVVSFVAAAPMQRERAPQRGRYWSWDQLANVRAWQCEVQVERQLVCEVGTPFVARDLAAKLREIAACEPTQRGVAIEQLRAAVHDVDAAKQRWNQWLESTIAVRIGAVLLFAWIWPVGLLLAYGGLPLPSTGWVVAGYVAVMFTLWWSTAFVGYLAHRYLYPDHRGERWKQLAYSLLSPAVPLRLSDALGRHLFGTLHPLAVSAAVDSQATFQRTAQQIVRDATYPQLPEEPPESEPVALQLIRESRQADRAYLQQILASRQLDESTALAAPPAEDPAEQSYCPRCLHSFVRPTATCEGCGGRQSISF